MLVLDFYLNAKFLYLSPLSPPTNNSYKIDAATLLNDISQTTMHDMEKTELIVFPIAMLILAYIVGNLPLMILPFIAMPCTILASFSLMYGVSTIMDVISFAPSIMLSISVALGIDYCMFLLVRVQEAYHKYGNMDDAIKLT